MKSRLQQRGFAKGIAGVVIALTMTAPAMAQQTRVYRDGSTWVEEITGSLPAARNLAIKLPIGNVEVEGVPQQTVTYVMRKKVRGGSEADARKQFERFRFSATRSGDSIMLQSDAPARTYISADLKVQAPRSTASVSARTSGGNETINGIDGRVEGQTSGGNLYLDNIGGVILASSGGGNITVGNAGSDVSLKTGGGNITIGSARGRIVTSSGGGNISIGNAQNMSVATGGGNINIQRCNGELKAQSGGGTLDLGQILGRAELQTGGGSIRLASATGTVSASSGGGNIELLNLSQGAKVDTGGGQIKAEFLGGSNFTGGNLQTPAGDIVVYLSGTLKATVKASVDIASGRGIWTDFGEIRVTREGEQYGPQAFHAEGMLNGGGAVLQLHTTTGSIRILRASK